MLKTRIIPCLDVADGRVVKGVNFVDLVDAGDPVEAARAYDAAGADEICFLDIHATHENRGTMFDLVTRTAEACFVPLTVGGGVRSHHDVRALLLAGADKVSFNSAAVVNPDVIAEAADRFGSQCIVCAIDAKTVAPGKWEIFTHGGRKPTGIRFRRARRGRVRACAHARTAGSEPGGRHVPGGNFRTPSPRLVLVDRARERGTRSGRSRSGRAATRQACHRACARYELDEARDRAPPEVGGRRRGGDRQQGSALEADVVQVRDATHHRQLQWDQDGGVREGDR